MGDISLVEAQSASMRKKLSECAKRWQRTPLTRRTNRTSYGQDGVVEQLLEMIPGAKGQISEDDIDKAEIRREKAIILSMTYAERANYHIMGPTRRKRVAAGSGTTVSDVNRLLKKFEKMRLTMKKLAKNKKYQAAMLKQMGM